MILFFKTFENNQPLFPIVFKMSAETDKLRNNLHAQLERLIDQLTDLDQNKDDMDESEYNEARQDTVEQLEDFNKSLEKMKSGEGGLSLLDDVHRMQNVCYRKNKILYYVYAIEFYRQLNVLSVKLFKHQKSFDFLRRSNQFNYEIV